MNLTSSPKKKLISSYHVIWRQKFSSQGVPFGIASVSLSLSSWLLINRHLRCYRRVMWAPLRTPVQVTRHRHYASLRNIVVQYLHARARALVCTLWIAADVVHSWDYRWTTFQKRHPISGHVAFSAIDLVCACSCRARVDRTKGLSIGASGRFTEESARAATASTMIDDCARSPRLY